MAGLKDGTIWLKWPNDLVADAENDSLRKVGGVLGESVTEGTRVRGGTTIIGRIR